MTKPSTESDSTRARILVVEDPSVLREMQTLLLRGAGYAVTTCDQPHVALLEAAQQAFDIVVINSDAPEADRPGFVRGLRGEHGRAAVIFIAPILTIELTRELTRQGVAVVLQRPVSPLLLIQKIEAQLPAEARVQCRQSSATGGSNAGTLPAVQPATDLGRSVDPLPFPAPNSSSPFLFSVPNSTFRSSSATPFGGNSASPFQAASRSPFSSVHRR